jgi:hypothetical protein
MTLDHNGLLDLLRADAERHAGAPARPVADDGLDRPGWAELRFNLVNTFPRLSRGVFAALRETLSPFGYTLSPLHPGADLHRPRMQTELARLPDHAGPQFAPLVFELERGTGKVRVFVRQFGGRAVPDFAERHIELGDALDTRGIEAILLEYVSCMIRPRAAA